MNSKLFFILQKHLEHQESGGQERLSHWATGTQWRDYRKARDIFGPSVPLMRPMDQDSLPEESWPWFS
jgi:hypothetical protein